MSTSRIRWAGNLLAVSDPATVPDVRALVREVVAVDRDIREGRFQRALALIAGLSSILSGLEVTYEHYRGSYGQRVMYTPVILSPALLVAGIWAYRDRRAAHTLLPAVSLAVLADSVIGFGFHVRGIRRKPGGWRLPIVNIIMGPPIFAPLLFGISGYLGLLATFLRREDAPRNRALHPALRPVQAMMEMRPSVSAPHRSWTQDLREGRFQKHLAASTAAWSFFSGIEALYSHYKNNFRYRMQWTPVVIAALLTGAGLGAVKSPRIARTLLPAASLLALADGSVGFVYHARGVLRRPGGLKLPFYNVMYGPPIFAPLLFAACGFLGALASLLRREA
jgi:hypothetical protein